MDYATLIADKSTPGSLRNFTNVARVDPATAVAFAEDLIFTGYVATGGMRTSALRIREMRQSSDFTLAAGEKTIDLPSPRFLDPVSLYSRTDRAYLAQVYEEALLAHRSYEDDGTVSEGIPSYYAIFDEQLQLDAASDEDRAMTMIFYARPEPLSGGNPTNWLTNRYGRLLFQACLAIVYEFDDDMPNYQRAMGQVMALLNAANAESDLSRRGILIDRETP